MPLSRARPSGGGSKEPIEVFCHHVLLARDGDVTETPEGDPSVIETDRVVVFHDGGWTIVLITHEQDVAEQASRQINIRDGLVAA